MKISKKLETKYIRSFEGERELNYPLGYRGIEIKFTNRRDFISEQEGEEYLICLEMYLNNNDLALYEYDGSRSVIANLAEITFVVNEDQIDEFTKVYKEFKANYETIINNYKHQTMHDEEEQETQEEITSVIVDNLEDYEAEKKKLYIEFEEMIKNNTNWQNEIIAVEKKDTVARVDIMQCIFLAHINQLSPDWVKYNVHIKEKWEFSDIIIKWARMAELDYKLSKRIIAEV